ncbi:MAG TPA: hypothetical protein H9715_01675 [Candidatus Merdibacter merdigallinarum]|nr:hypothetical protein [Candidatus Merdibacter merdigallinarum]
MVDVEKLRKVKQCIDSLAEGLNPFTGQPLPEEDIVNDVRVSRSLFLASAFLQEQMQGKTEKKNGKKQAFRLSLEERDRVEFSSRPISASELARRMNNAAGAQDCKKITYRQITDWLVEVGMLKLVENVAGTQRRPTESGKKMGISVESRIGQSGPYQVVLYSAEAQRFIVDNVDAIMAFALDKEKGAQRNL